MIPLLHGWMWNAIEATLLCVVVAIVVRLGRPGAPLRHALWCLVLLRLIVPPVGFHSYGLAALGTALLEDMQSYATRRIGPDTTPHQVWTISEESIDTASVGPLASMPQTGMPMEMAGIEDAQAADRTVLFETSSVQGSVSSEETPSESGRTIAAYGIHLPNSIRHFATTLWYTAPRWALVQSLLCSWLAGSLCLVVLRLKQCVHVLRVVAGGEPASGSIVNTCREIADHFDLKRIPVLKIVAPAISPTVCALGRATIVLPVKLVDGCGPHVARAVLAHELAHLKRRDHWICWVELLASILYWWHPAFWWARRQMRRAADEAADAWAVSVLGARARYAESLLQTVELLVADRTIAPAWGLALGERDTIARRLTMIMKGPLCHRLSRPAWLGIAVIGLLVLPASPPRAIAQEAKSPPDQGVSVPTAEEIEVVVELLEQDQPDAGRQRRGRTPEPPQPPAVPRSPELPVPPGSPGQPERAEARERRDPERRLNELEQKVDRILQMLQAMQGGGGPGGGAGFPGAPGGLMPNQPQGGRFRGMGSMGMPGMSSGGMGGRVGAPPGAAGPGADTPSGGPGGGAGFGLGGQPPGSQPPAAPGAGGGFGGRGGMMGRSGPDMGPGSGLFGGGGGIAPGAPNTPYGVGPAGSTDARPRLPAGAMGGPGLSPEQRERVETLQREFQAEMQKMEVEQQRIMAEFQRRRAEIERRQAELMQEIMTSVQREREGGRRDGDRRSDTPESRRRPDGERPREGGEPRRGPDRSRDGDEPARRPEGDRPRDGGDGRI